MSPSTLTQFSTVRWLRFGVVLFAFALTVPSAAAAPGDKAGWQFRIEGEDESEQQYLIYAERDDGPRILTLACKRNIDTFGFYAEDLRDLVGPVAKATMVLKGGPATFTIPGDIEPDPETQALGFAAEMPRSRAELKLEETLTAMLLTGQPIRMSFGTKSRDLPPVKGMLDPAKRFLRSCFRQQ
jgi:hypothetical protein